MTTEFDDFKAEAEHLVLAAAAGLRADLEKLFHSHAALEASKTVEKAAAVTEEATTGAIEGADAAIEDKTE